MSDDPVVPDPPPESPAAAYTAIKNRLTSLGGSFVGDPPDAAPLPYSFVWGPPLILGDPTVGGMTVVDRRVHVTVVHSTANNVLRMASEVEGLLAGWSPSVVGWRFHALQVVGSESVRTPHSIIETNTNRSPAWVVLHVRVRGQKSG